MNLHFPIKPDADEQPVFLGFEMDIARALDCGGAQNRIERARRIAVVRVGAPGRGRPGA